MGIPDHEHQHTERKAIANRLSRIEGHVRKIKEMVEENRDCPDILIQLAAVRSAINKTGQAVLEDHLESCLFHIGLDPEDNKIWKEVQDALDIFF